jgi:regulation of enolase protein 1 (concanavalin A-like superfamily)
MADVALHESFAGERLDDRLRWHCEPSRWRLDRDAPSLRIEPDAGTDFWQRTHYGFEVDNGHFLGLRASGDFVLTTRVSSRWRHQYDQAGLMVRVSADCWLKTSVEFEPDGPNRLGVVVTNDRYSDWSTQALAQDVTTVWLRVRAEADDCIVDTSLDGRQWQQIRMAHLRERAAAGSVSCGLYACSPKAGGYVADFHFLDFKPGRVDL